MKKILPALTLVLLLAACAGQEAANSVPHQEAPGTSLTQETEPSTEPPSRTGWRSSRYPTS